MKKIISVLIITLLVFSAFGQQPVGSGNNQFNAGVGFSSRGLPVYIGFDHGFKNDFSFGGELSARAYNERYYKVYYHHSIIGISGNFNYHFNRIFKMPPEWNFYAGANVGFNIWISPSTYGGADSSGLGLGGQVGGRYFFNDKFGLNLELNAGNAFNGGKFGITVML